MGCSIFFIWSTGFSCFIISLFFLSILGSTHMRFMAEQDRAIEKQTVFSHIGREEKMLLRAKIGSRPPRCERKCSSCGHCEAIQVPTNGNIKSSSSSSSSSSSMVSNHVAYARGDDYYSNYKPMSWKCKCGDIIFNP